MVNYDEDNGTDTAGFESKLSLIKWKSGFNKKDIIFWFSQFEAELEGCGVKSQYQKRQALARLLPEEATKEVKTLLIKGKEQAGNQCYKQVKTALIKVYALKKEEFCTPL